MAWTLASPLRPSRFRTLRLAAMLGWAGPLPGALMAYAAVRGDFASFFLVTPKDVVLLGLTYAAFVVPLFGSYCFVVGLLGVWFVDRCGRRDSPAWGQQVAIVVTSVLAAVPITLMAGGMREEIGRYAMVSALLWGSAALVFRGKIFVASEP